MRIPQILWILALMFMIPGVNAASVQDSFPDVTFKAFNQFVNANFDDKISLATVLMVLFTMTDNTDLFNLHARQKHPTCDGEYASNTTRWIKSLAHRIKAQLQGNTKILFTKFQLTQCTKEDDIITSLASKLDVLAVLDLTPYDSHGTFQNKLHPVSYNAIQSVKTICPASFECEDTECEPRGLLQATKIRDILTVKLIKGTSIYYNVAVLSGKCSKCKSIYYADHESVMKSNDNSVRVYLNTAQYLKIGREIWVDRVFSNAVIGGMYSFHASAAAYTDFWNDAYGNADSTNGLRITRRHIWKAFIQESTRSIALESKLHLELDNNIPINEVTTQAFSILGEGGRIRPADGHACSECTQPFSAVPEYIPQQDPAAVVGVDENGIVPPLAIQDPASENNSNNIEPSAIANNYANDVDADYAPVKMVVLDGIVMGPTHCAYDDCTDDLGNARGGVFCPHHEIIYGATCRICDCTAQNVPPTEACQAHQKEWSKYSQNHSRQNLAGVRRMLQRPGENMPWEPATRGNAQPHDEESTEHQRKHYFSPARFYCVETICAPCGTVIAWTKFDKSESPTNILNFLEDIYPTEESRPDYICIDKACLLLRSSIANGSWDMWSKTSRFIVDSYHYINHRTEDYICRKWCNPAPLNGSAPNLVVIAYDRQGNPYYKRAYNTQACEQLNSWLGGFESILKRMTPGNFNWFLHVMLFYHTKYVLAKQKAKRSKKTDIDDDSDDI
ncbi:hypothetical protein BD779DRAFT_1449392 [Infundibulicybe gibba]|nr:hypothetical protein BD779DRAFT_1449392 [Infundibulicybe gibba]